MDENTSSNIPWSFRKYGSNKQAQATFDIWKEISRSSFGILEALDDRYKDLYIKTKELSDKHEILRGLPPSVATSHSQSSEYSDGVDRTGMLLKNQTASDAHKNTLLVAKKLYNALDPKKWITDASSRIKPFSTINVMDDSDLLSQQMAEVVEQLEREFKKEAEEEEEEEEEEETRKNKCGNYQDPIHLPRNTPMFTDQQQQQQQQEASSYFPDEYVYLKMKRDDLKTLRLDIGIYIEGSQKIVSHCAATLRLAEKHLQYIADTADETRDFRNLIWSRLQQNSMAYPPFIDLGVLPAPIYNMGRGYQPPPPAKAPKQQVHACNSPNNQSANNSFSVCPNHS